MKLNKTLLSAFLVLTSIATYGQLPAARMAIQKKSNIAELTRMSQMLKQKSEENLQKALRYARANNWPLVKQTEDGHPSHLAGITDDLKPIYAIPLNGGAAATTRADRLYSGGGLGLSLHGENMIVGVWDNGRARPDHEALTGRVTVMDPATNTTNANHATHVSGTLIGADIVPKRTARGIAFLANLDNYDYIFDESEMATAASNGLLLSNHSYTMGGYWTAYTYRSYNIDGIAFNAPYYLPVFACGNSGPSNYTITMESVSKNVIAVANTLEQRNYTGPSSVVASSSSSRGPSSDFRVKPDIATKGTSVYSSTITSTTSYDFGFGTSMAAPGVTATLLLLQQHYNDVNSQFMLAATAKGLALHTADEAGANAGPDITFGWGLINAEFAANTITRNGKSALIREDSLANHDTITQVVTSSGVGPLRVSICWTDRPPEDYSSPTLSQLVNDLDLRVSDGTTTYYPWRIDQSNVSGAALNNGDNDRDNFERIDIANPGFGTSYTITITHKGDLFDDLPQNFSLVITGITNCEFGDPTLTITAPITSSVDHEGYSLITASSAISDGITVNFWANASVLNPGFVVNRQASSNYFLAYTGPCEDESSLRSIVRDKQEPVPQIVKGPVTVPAVKTQGNVSVDCAPNPSNGIFNVFVNNIREGLLQVIDVSGRPIYQTSFRNRNVINVDLGHNARGFYLVRVVMKDGVITRKIIVE